MKANTHQKPGSTRSRRTPLSQSAASARRFPAVCGKCVHYAYKMRPNLKTQILIPVASATYKFDPQKCTHFPVHHHPARAHGADPHLSTMDSAAGESRSFSPRDKVRMRDKPVSSRPEASCHNSLRILYSKNRIKMSGPLTNDAKGRDVAPSTSAAQCAELVSTRGHARNRTKQNDFRFRSISPTPYQRLTTKRSPLVRFLELGVCFARPSAHPAFLYSWLPQRRGAENEYKMSTF
jgi:hypothetical protein